nr:hypothetical protein [Leuven Tombus-like virus 4]
MFADCVESTGGIQPGSEEPNLASQTCLLEGIGLSHSETRLHNACKEAQLEEPECERESVGVVVGAEVGAEDLHGRTILSCEPAGQCDGGRSGERKQLGDMFSLLDPRRALQVCKDVCGGYVLDPITGFIETARDLRDNVSERVLSILSRADCEECPVDSVPEVQPVAHSEPKRNLALEDTPVGLGKGLVRDRDARKAAGEDKGAKAQAPRQDKDDVDGAPPLGSLPMARESTLGVKPGKRPLPRDWKLEIAAYLKNQSAFNPKTHTEARILHKKALDWFEGYDLEAMGICSPEAFKVCVTEIVNDVMLDTQAAERLNKSMFGIADHLGNINGFLRKGNAFGCIVPGWVLVFAFFFLWFSNVHYSYTVIDLLFVPLDYIQVSHVVWVRNFCVAYAIDACCFLAFVLGCSLSGSCLSRVLRVFGGTWSIGSFAWLLKGVTKNQYVRRWQETKYERVGRCVCSRAVKRWTAGETEWPCGDYCEGCSICGKRPTRGDGMLNRWLDWVKPLDIPYEEFPSRACSSGEWRSPCYANGALLSGGHFPVCGNAAEDCVEMVETVETVVIEEPCDEFGKLARSIDCPNDAAVVCVSSVYQIGNVKLPLTWFNYRLNVPCPSRRVIAATLFLAGCLVWVAFGSLTFNGYLAHLYDSAHWSDVQTYFNGLGGSVNPWVAIRESGDVVEYQKFLGIVEVHVDTFYERMTTAQHVYVIWGGFWAAMVEILVLRRTLSAVRTLGAPN